MSDDLLVRQDGPILRITINRPHDGNRVTDEMAMDDTRALIGQLGGDYPCSAGGYCMGGRHALPAGGTFRDSIKIAACLHGRNLVKDTAASPHLLEHRTTGDTDCALRGHHHARAAAGARPSPAARRAVARAGGALPRSVGVS